MPLETELLTHPLFPITVRQFGEGSALASRENGITVIIDVFRASNTILALLEAGVNDLVPVEIVEELAKYPNYVKVGEDRGKKIDVFDYDNSPSFIAQNPDLFTEKDVVIRTTNGTRGIVNAIGSKKIIIGTFRNLQAVVDHVYSNVEKGVPISFVAMGTLHTPRIEDYYCAYMMFSKLAQRLPMDAEAENEIKSLSNLWNVDWKAEIMEKRSFVNLSKEDRLYSLELNKTRIIPIYDQTTSQIKII